MGFRGLGIRIKFRVFKPLTLTSSQDAQPEKSIWEFPKIGNPNVPKIVGSVF